MLLLVLVSFVQFNGRIVVGSIVIVLKCAAMVITPILHASKEVKEHVFVPSPDVTLRLIVGLEKYVVQALIVSMLIALVLV